MHMPRANNLALVVLSNILPLLGVLLAGWDIYTLLIFYWMETVIVAFWTVMTMAFHTGLETWTFDGPTQRNAGFSVGGPVLVFVHSGFFMAIHLHLMSALYGGDWPGHLRSPEVFLDTFLVGQKLWPMLALVFVHRAAIFWEERNAASLSPVIASLYMRIVVMQVVIIIGAWGVMLLGSGLFGLILLITMRAGLDLYWPTVLAYVLDKTNKAGASR
jgi:hypothetical protein